ncbi:hypothetical protein ACFZCY_00510 [Streptomyces sp. NPDC007983]|uniref:hypothetical protein n=1 Tax=Streptomyces sp. NPDC007983 TaxID=3364800 RepID=UPI0036E4B18B
MGISILRRQTATTAPDLSGIRPLPVWFFLFEGVLGGAYDLGRAWHGAWMILVAIGVVNIAVGATVLRRRAKLVRAMLKKANTRKIAVGLVGLRLGVHLVLGALGTPVTSVAGHLVLAVLMSATTVTLLWFNQRVTFRALGLA